MDCTVPQSERLRKSGLKYTKQRASILDILQEADQPLSAEQIYTHLGEHDIPACLSTIYRSLEAMSAKGIVTKINIIQQDKSFYEINCGMHRHYLFCLGCNKIMTIKNCPLEDYERSLTEQTHYDIVGHKLSIYGYCPECQKAMKQQKSLDKNHH